MIVYKPMIVQWVILHKKKDSKNRISRNAKSDILQKFIALLSTPNQANL